MKWNSIYAGKNKVGINVIVLFYNYQELLMFFSRMFTIALVSMVFFLLSCSEDDNNNTGPSEEEFQSLSSPYLICAGRNPGGAESSARAREHHRLNAYIRVFHLLLPSLSGV